jgi:hypothetical protein
MTARKAIVIEMGEGIDTANQRIHRVPSGQSLCTPRDRVTVHQATTGPLFARELNRKNNME